MGCSNNNLLISNTDQESGDAEHGECDFNVLQMCSKSRARVQLQCCVNTIASGFVLAIRYYSCHDVNDLFDDYLTFTHVSVLSNGAPASDWSPLECIV